MDERTVLAFWFEIGIALQVYAQQQADERRNPGSSRCVRQGLKK